MFKVVMTVRSSGVIGKRRFYESESSFRKWLGKHRSRVKQSYDVAGYELVDGEWLTREENE